MTDHMPSNPYHKDAMRYVVEAGLRHEWPEEERAVIAANAQALATLALAYEQRTANYIDQVDMAIYAQHIQLEHNVTLSQELHDQGDAIHARLGLTKD